MDEITDEVISEGYILTLEDNREFLLIQKVKQCFFAVGIINDEPDGHYYMLEDTRDNQGNICMTIKADLGRI